MADIFGAMSVVTLFTSCVDCFEYIQLSRRFGQDFQSCQLKLDVARLRLSRWGESVNVHTDFRFAAEAPPDHGSRMAQNILEEIEELFQRAQKKSMRYKLSNEHEDLTTFEHEDMQQITQGLHSRLSIISRRRQQRTSSIKKAIWALYDGKEFERLLEKLIESIDSLEKEFPTGPTRRRLLELEMEEVNDEPSLLALQSAAAVADSELSDAALKKLENISGKNYAKKVKIGEKASLHVGSLWTGAALDRRSGVADPTTNKVGSLAAKGQSTIRIGNMYG